MSHYITNHQLNKKSELLLTRCAKAFNSCCSQTVLVYLQQFHRNSLLKCAPQSKIAKINKTPYFGSSGSFKVINVDTSKKLVTSAHAYLQPLSRKTGQQQQNNDLYGSTGLWCSCAQVSLNLENQETVEIYVQCWKFCMQLVLVYLYWFRCHSLLKRVRLPISD